MWTIPAEGPVLHIAMFVGIGLVGVAAFFFGAGLLGRSGASGAAIFLWFWFFVSVANGIYGAIRAGIPVLTEVGAFTLIFGIPGLIAWYLAYRYGAGR
jgi:hypothetical protein